MERVFNFWNKGYYTESLLILVLCYSLFISIKNNGKFAILNWFPYYTASLLIVTLSRNVYVFLFPLERRKQTVRIDHFIDHIFTLVEIIILGNFFMKIMVDVKKKRIIRMTILLFVMFFIYGLRFSLISLKDINRVGINMTYTAEAIVLIFFCSLYFHQIFKSEPTLRLTNEPSFWVSTGVLFFMCGSLPYSLLENYLINKYFEMGLKLYAIFYFFYVLFFLLIVRAYLCTPNKNI